MYAAHIIEPKHMGIPERHKVVLCEKKSERDRLVRYVNKNAEDWREFRRECPHGIVPYWYHWYMDTTCEAITMREARKLIAGDDYVYESDGWSESYACVPCTVYEFSVLPYGGRIGWKDGRHYTNYGHYTDEEGAA